MATYIYKNFKINLLQLNCIFGVKTVSNTRYRPKNQSEKHKVYILICLFQKYGCYLLAKNILAAGPIRIITSLCPLLLLVLNPALTSTWLRNLHVPDSYWLLCPCTPQPPIGCRTCTCWWAGWRAS
jgi:hypothetical protein